MAASTRALMKASASSIGLTRRTVAGSAHPLLSSPASSSCIAAPLCRTQLQRQFRRTYADVAPVKKPRRFRFFRNLWRLTYISAIAGTAYLAYGVYDLRHPEDQFEPDPSKKNLVILGKRAILTPFAHL
jgi:NADH:ubiquinone reductase (non-electrogenic)